MADILAIGMLVEVPSRGGGSFVGTVTAFVTLDPQTEATIARITPANPDVQQYLGSRTYEVGRAHWSAIKILASPEPPKRRRCPTPAGSWGVLGDPDATLATPVSFLKSVRWALDVAQAGESGDAHRVVAAELMRELDDYLSTAQDRPELVLRPRAQTWLPGNPVIPGAHWDWDTGRWITDVPTEPGAE